MPLRRQELYGNLSTMLDAGLSIKRALAVSVQNSTGRTQSALIAVADAVDSGATLADAMRGSSEGVFSEADVSIIEAGELSGRLAESFTSLGDWYQVKSRTWNAIWSGLALPLVQLHAAALILPIPALVLGNMTLGGYLMTVFFFMLVFLYIPLGVVLAIWRQSGVQGRARGVIDPILLKVPLLGAALRDAALARYCEGFRALYDAGVLMPRCAEIAVELCDNAAVAAMLEGGAKSAHDGNPVSEGFSRNLPHGFIELWTVGEHAGRLAETLQRLSAQHQQQAEHNLKQFGRWVPKICMFLVILLLAYLILTSYARLPRIEI